MTNNGTDKVCSEYELNGCMNHVWGNLHDAQGQPISERGYCHECADAILKEYDAPLYWRTFVVLATA